MKITRRSLVKYLLGGSASLCFPIAYAQKDLADSKQQTIADLGQALVPIHSKVHQQAWQKVWQQLPDSKAYWLELFFQYHQLERRTQGRRRSELAVIKIFQTPVGNEFNRFLDEVYKAVSENDIFLSVIYKHGPFRIGRADKRYF